MISLLKTFGKGLLYVIGAPFFVVALVLFGAIGLVAFIFQIFKSIIYFFTGQKFFPELPEDKKLRLMREESNASSQTVMQENVQSIVSPIIEEPAKQIEPEPIFIQREEKPAPDQSIEQACFEDTSSLEDFINQKEEQIEETKEETIEEEHTVLETTEEKKEDEETFEELETYVPRSSTYSAADEDENDTDSGVNINYDL